jgi:hypothetical protein
MDRELVARDATLWDLGRYATGATRQTFGLDPTHLWCKDLDEIFNVTAKRPREEHNPVVVSFDDVEIVALPPKKVNSMHYSVEKTTMTVFEKAASYLAPYPIGDMTFHSAWKGAFGFNVYEIWEEKGKGAGWNINKDELQKWYAKPCHELFSYCLEKQSVEREMAIQDFIKNVLWIKCTIPIVFKNKK